MRRIKRFLQYFFGIVLIAASSISPSVALTTAETVERGGAAYEELSSCASTPITGEEVSGDQAQINNARTVIGIAKAYNLGQEGARIGLITALVESNLKILSNTNVPVSAEYPNVQGSGSDHDSVGIMQQRVGSGWSTFGSGTSQEIVFQLMDPAYSTQAFFGTPEGAKLPDNLANPGALQKGMLNKVPDWRSKDPGEVAQTVQVSAFPERYATRIPEANSLIEELWNTSPALPLPIPIGDVPQAAAGCLSGNAVADILTTVKLYAWPDYCRRDSSSCPGYATPVTAKPEYRAATSAAFARGEYIGDRCGDNPATSPDIGADCGAFVTRVIRDSKADVEYNKYEGNTADQLRYLLDYSVGNKKGNPERYYHLSPSDPLQPGDIAVQNNERTHHTYLYVGEIAGFNGAYASASQCERTGMASGGSENERNVYEWFRLIQGAPVPAEGAQSGQQP